jgi:hypothetical protein
MNKSTENDGCDSFENIIRGCTDKKTRLCKLVFETYLRECKSQTAIYHSNTNNSKDFSFLKKAVEK